jgi:hypothetical protein
VDERKPMNDIETELGLDKSILAAQFSLKQ